MGPKAINALLRLYNRTWHNGATPSAWRTSVVVPILKKRKKACDLASYRPISVTSAISKIVERMVNGRLHYYMEDSGLLDENQAGFRRHRSTVNQLVLFTQSVINAWQHNQHIVVVFVDLKHANDRIFSKFASHIYGKKSKAGFATYGYSAFLVYRGYEDSQVNTDNAWHEAEIFNFHYKHKDNFSSRRKNDDNVEWQIVTEHISLSPSDMAAVREAEKIRTNSL
ncbi:hypothetical protein RRG08_054562 [Elysia crispata]|uniref:Reverse transcriptase domain-containing protein n=1 Tax=Elysia crispata TaxID=231223 RepID=A0AAE1B280_9GAST|nr:hypothetical protein RRG08_054562 [Elysia crispata]